MRKSSNSNVGRLAFDFLAPLPRSPPRGLKKDRAAGNRATRRRLDMFTNSYPNQKAADQVNGRVSAGSCSRSGRPQDGRSESSPPSGPFRGGSHPKWRKTLAPRWPAVATRRRLRADPCNGPSCDAGESRCVACVRRLFAECRFAPAPWVQNLPDDKPHCNCGRRITQNLRKRKIRRNRRILAPKRHEWMTARGASWSGDGAARGAPAATAAGGQFVDVGDRYGVTRRLRTGHPGQGPRARRVRWGKASTLAKRSPGGAVRDGSLRGVDCARQNSSVSRAPVGNSGAEAPSE